LGRKPIPRPSLLDACEYLGYVYGARRWRDPANRLLYTWDTLHGEIEAFTFRGEHRGALDPITGDYIKPSVKGRRIRV
jgi:Cytotoxic